MIARLILIDGTVYEGLSIGASGTAVGEVVFNTAMTGYQEILTDPSYAGQLVALTYPLIGNYGVTAEDDESVHPQVAGFIVREMCAVPSNYRATGGGDDYLRENGVIGIEGVDVRAVVRRIRTAGVMLGMITTEHEAEAAVAILRATPSYDSGLYARQVSTPRPYQWSQHIGPGVPQQWEMPLDAAARVVVMDYGTKFNILRSLRSRGLEVIVLPCTATLEEILAWKPDGVVLSPGPGDPAMLEDEVQVVRRLMDGQPGLPVFGICLGHQIMGRALGGTTFKLKFGHRGANHPVKDLLHGTVHITSQNHGYAVAADSLPPEVEVTHLNLNDNTVEGLRHLTLPICSVQYHPEASPGPRDNAYLFDQFATLVKARKHS